jgi:HTH-type transcriptional regulator/antitoxin HipB
MGDEASWTEFDAGGHVARARRVADLSQRELADEVGVNQATVARWESGSPALTVAMLSRVLRLAGLRLQVVDEEGDVVPPFGADAVRDNAGRRFPAHLDVVAPDRRPINRGAGPRYDRAEPQGWYALRPTRDAAREGCRADVAEAERPADHPTVAQLAERSAARRAQQAPVLEPLAECACPDSCFEEPACGSGCSCQCESRSG